ncbi:MAG: S8 family serine peptidase, partial [Dermatophilaceae bacterium]
MSTASPSRAVRRALVTVAVAAAAIAATTAVAVPTGAAATSAAVATTATAVPAGTAPTPPSAASSGRFVSAGATVSESDPVKQVRGTDRLGQRDRELLATARRTGARRVTMLVTTQRGRTEDVTAAVRGQGGTVVTRNDRVGYVRASVPTARVERVAGAARVLAVDLDERTRRPDPSAEPAPARRAAVTTTAAGPGPATPLDNAYLPVRETGSVAFRAAHPAWDGRGVTIGILDSGVDLDHPALSTTSTGERKIVDWVTATDPVFDGDGTWRAMLTDVTGPSFTYEGGTWTAPAGTYKINRFSESITAASEPAGDVNRDGDTIDRFGVLYDPVSNDVWVDADQDQAFEPTERMRPYEETADVRHFGGATDPTERMPFVVEYREDVDATAAGLPGLTDFVNIGIVEDAHGTHVAGIAAGNDLFGGAMDGQAPGARLVSSRACTWGAVCTAAALTDGMVDLVANRGVDVVNMSIGALPALNDANNARARLYDALIEEYGVQIVVAAGNDGPGLNTVGDPSVATDVVSVGSSVSKATWLSNYGAIVSREQALHNYSSRGPREDGGFKPNVMAPGSAISTVPQWLKQPDVAEAGYTLPLGYAMFNGTSMAAPQAAGAAALLLSAAGATGTPVSPRQLRESMYTAADFVAGLEAVSQGNGLVDVPEAWALLAARPATPTFSTKAPVCTPISDLLAVPGEGSGLYDRCEPDAGGLAVGVRRVYDVRVARTSGGRWRTHRVSIVGNDGTFSAPGTAVVGSVERSVRVTAAPTTPGLHSAILQIDDPATPLVDHRVMLAVVAAEGFPSPGYSRIWTGSTERNLYRRHFVTVAPGADVLQVGLSGVAAGHQVRWIAVDPYGLPVDDTASSQCYTGLTSGCPATSRAYPDPIPGVWELYVEARRTSSALTSAYTLTAALQGTTLTPAVQNVTTAVGTARAITPIRVRSDFGPVSVTPQDATLGSSRTARPSVTDGAATEFTVAVPTGASRLEVAIGNPADLGADLDLSVYRGSTLVGQDADGDSEEAVVLDRPSSGTYRVVVEGYDVPAGATAFDYLDVFTASSLGSVDVGNTALSIASGATATVSGTVTPR